MSWHFLQAAAEESWGDSCLVGAPAALLSMTPTVAPAFFNDNLKGTCIVSPCGMTLRRSTGTRGMDSLTWYQGDSPVRTYLPPARVEASGQAGRDSGPSSPGSLAKFNPHLYGWRTAQCLLDGGLMSFAETWPRWGMMQGGELFPLPTPSGLTLLREVISQYSTTFGNESGFSQRVPTPNSSEGDGGGQNPETGKREGHQLRLRDAVKRVPTPRSEDSQCSGGHRDKDDTLYGLICRPKVTRLGTPRKADYKGCGPVGGGGHSHMLKKGYLCAQAAIPRIPTPTGNMVSGGANHNSPSVMAGKHGINLEGAVLKAMQVPTPTVACAKGGQTSRGGKRKNEPLLAWVAGGSLNPDWVEWLQGWPIGWTACQPLETASVQRWLNSHGSY